MDQLISSARFIVETLRSKGFDAYYAGGCVRDLLLGLPSEDIDIATSATPEEVMAIFVKTIPLGLAFGSVIVVLERINFEVTTFRTDATYSDGRHPDGVVFSSPEEDAQRRSFTINGMFFDPLENKIHDFVGGEEDLRRGLIRAIGNPMERFGEDKLRLLRAARFASRFDFQIEAKTRKGIHAHATQFVEVLSAERIWQEFTKVKPPYMASFLQTLDELELLSPLFPESAGKPHFDELRRRYSYYPHDAPTILYLLPLFKECSPSDVIARFRTLKVANEVIDWIEVMAQVEALVKSDSIVDWVRFYAHPKAIRALAVYGAQLNDVARQAFLCHHMRCYHYELRHVERIAQKNRLVTAAHLIERGIKKGPELGALLGQAEEIAITHHLDTAEEVLKEMFPPSSPAR